MFKNLYRYDPLQHHAEDGSLVRVVVDEVLDGGRGVDMKVVSKFAFTFAVLITCCSVCSGQSFEISSPDQAIASPGTGTTGFSAVFSIEQVAGTTEDTKGFSFAYRHDPALLEVVGSNPFVPATMGELTALNSGTGPDFIQGEVFLDGFTVGVIYAFVDQSQVITFEVAKPMIEVDYATLPGAFSGVSSDVVTDLVSASDMGEPPTSTVVVIGAGVSAATTATTCSLTFQAAPPLDFEVSCADQSATFVATTGAGSFSTALLIGETVAAGSNAADTQGFSFGVGHDGTVLDATGVDYGAALAILEGGNGPEYFQVGLFSGGLTVGCIYDFQGTSFLGFGVPTEIASAHYDTVPAALAGSDPGASVSTTLTPQEGLGPNGVTNVIVVDGQSITMSGQSGTIMLLATGGFDRGDCNDDGNFDIGDPVTLLSALFLGGAVGCDDSCDGNDDEAVDIADAVNLLGALFSGGPQPPGAGTCAPDPTEGGLTCDVYLSCN